MNCPFERGKGLEKNCFNCASELTGRRTRWCSDKCYKEWQYNHWWSAARKKAKRRDKYQCVKCGSKLKLEVNHVIPILGKHSQSGCHHHIDGLETLCHRCHVGVTNEQRRQRAKT